MHTSLWVLAAVWLIGAGVSMLRPPVCESLCLSVATGLRIGEVVKLVGTTPRTIRCYEEIGLLPAEHDRASGQHRLYGEREVERLREALRLKGLLGLSLEELRELLEAEDARAALRQEWHTAAQGAERQREMLAESLGQIDRQLALVRRHHDEIAALEDELASKRRRVRRLLQELGET